MLGFVILCMLLKLLLPKRQSPIRSPIHSPIRPRLFSISDFYAVIRKDTADDSPARVLYDWIQSADGKNLIRHEGYSIREQ